MKIRLAYTIFFGLLLLIVSLGNKNGRASTFPGHGNTGAPGDEALPNGTPIVCNNCHTPSTPNPITSTTSIVVLDSNNDTITKYVPGAQYTARVTVQTATGNPTRWGFQMIALRDADTTDLDGFSDMNPNNYKIATVSSTGRTYAEHDNVSMTNTFNVKWTAPAIGTGNVTFYAAGNAVNNNGLISGDGPSFSNLKLAEDSASSTQNIDAKDIALQIWPNPAASEINLSAVLPRAGDYRAAIFDLSGRVVWESNRSLPAGENLLQVPMTGFDGGVYFVTLSGAGVSANVKVVKF
jgi:hypothetical protein